MDSFFLSRSQKETLISQKAKAIWLTGLSGSGKTTLAQQLEIKLHKAGFLVKVLDGDLVRATLSRGLGFSEEDRKKHIDHIAKINREFLDCGIIVINCFISPNQTIRDNARTIIGSDDFVEVYVNCPLKICETRDPKGLYAKARKGLIKNFTGIDSPYVPPKTPDIVIDTELLSKQDAADKLFEYVLPLVTYP